MSKKEKWTEREELLIRWFYRKYESGQFPEGGFQLSPWSKVSNGEKYFLSLKKDIEMGPSCPRRKYGILCGDLQRLFFMFETEFKKNKEV